MESQIQFASLIEKIRLGANKAIMDETNRLQMEDGPTNLSELLDKIFSTEAINKAQTHAAAQFNPIQDLINGVGNVFNGISGGVSDIINGGVSLINGENKPAPGGNPVAGGNPIVVVGGTTGGNGGNKPTTSPTGGLFQQLAFVTNDTGHVLSEITGGILNADVLNQAFSLAGSTIEEFLAGKISLGEGINRVYDFFAKLYGAENPLGKFIQSLATYLSNNQDGIFANIIKFGTFINAAVVTTVAIIINAASNIVSGIGGGAIQLVSGIINTIFGGFFHRSQSVAQSDFAQFQSALYDTVFTQAAQGTLDKTSYAQQIVDIITTAIKKVLVADPFIYTILSKPDEANIKKAIDAIVTVFTAPRP